MKIEVKENKLLYNNEYGGFSEDGKEYKIKIKNGERTPLPWSHILTNEKLGTLITSNGGGYTWYGNSRENKLTVWSNDAVEDPPSELIYSKSENEIYTATPVQVKQDYLITYGFGYAMYETEYEGINQNLTIFVPSNKNAKISCLTMENQTEEEKTFHVVYWLNPVLGVHREETKKHLFFRKIENGIEMNNYYRENYAEEPTYLTSSVPIQKFTCEKEFIQNGEITKEVEGICKNPCVALEVEITLSAKEKKTIYFSLSVGEKVDDIAIQEELENTKKYWCDMLQKVQVKTPVESMNLMLNGWLLYQTISSRLFARTAFYQAGGAFGFRDQLQDVLSLLICAPELARKQILYHASHQFLEGDVLHWWHPEKNNGIRTKFKDDYLWLPYVTAEYIQVTGDQDILEEEIPYIEGKELLETETEVYQEVRTSEISETLYQHCLKAITLACNYGEKGLPQMGSGDWNDGMNLVGGESVWLGFFLYDVLQKFSKIVEKKQDISLKKQYEKEMQKLKEALNKNGWDGRWYRRAYFKDGTPLRFFAK